MVVKVEVERGALERQRQAQVEAEENIHALNEGLVDMGVHDVRHRSKLRGGKTEGNLEHPGFPHASAFKFVRLRRTHV